METTWESNPFWAFSAYRILRRLDSLGQSFVGSDLCTCLPEECRRSGERGKVVFECAADQAFVTFVLAFLEWLAALTLRLLHPAMRQT